MVNNYFDTAYKSRVEFRGVSKKDKIVNEGIRNFERYLATAATKETIIFGYDEIEVSIQTSSQDEVGQRYEKLMLAPLESGLDVGDVFLWNDSPWLFLTKVQLSIPTHIKGKIRECNHILKWYSGGELLEVPAHVITNRGLGVSEGTSQGIISIEPSLVSLAIVPLTEETKTIKREQRFITSGQAWRVTSIDDTSVEKLRLITMKEDIVDMAKDKPDDQVANVYIADEETGKVTVDGVEYLVEGESTISWNQFANYSAKIDGELAEDIEFQISDIELAGFVSKPDDNPVQIFANNKGLIGTFKLIVPFTAEIIVSKTIKVVSLWG